MNGGGQGMLDLQALHILEGGARAAVTTWAAAAADANDERLRRYFGEMASQILTFQSQVRARIRQMGGTI